jgi:hypothetical protein
MTPADGIRKLGFRRWYERQLIESHAYFITCFLCMIVVVACLETINFTGEPFAALKSIALVLSAGLLGIFALKRYKNLLDRAEYLAQHSTCPHCNVYGRLQVLEASASRGGDDAGNAWMRVQCRQCNHRWLIE